MFTALDRLWWRFESRTGGGRAVLLSQNGSIISGNRLRPLLCGKDGCGFLSPIQLIGKFAPCLRKGTDIIRSAHGSVMASGHAHSGLLIVKPASLLEKSTNDFYPLRRDKKRGS